MRAAPPTWPGTPFWGALLYLSVSAASSAAQDEHAHKAPRGPALAPIALIDIKHVLDHDPAFRWQKDELDAGAALAEAVIGQRKEEIRELAQRLRGLQAGSAEHTELDLEILRQTAELKSQVERARRKLAAEEARVYVEAYREIVQAVEAHLDETDCRLVLRIDAPNIDAPNVVLGAGRLAPVEDPAERPQSIHRTVVSSQDAADITPAILRRLAADRQKSAARMRRPARR